MDVMARSRIPDDARVEAGPCFDNLTRRSTAAEDDSSLNAQRRCPGLVGSAATAEAAVVNGNGNRVTHHPADSSESSGPSVSNTTLDLVALDHEGGAGRHEIKHGPHRGRIPISALMTSVDARTTLTGVIRRRSDRCRS